MIQHSQASLDGRRGELMAELFLQDLNPQYVARPADSSAFGFDFIVAFANKKGGLNTFAVEVKSTSKPVGSTFTVRTRSYTALANSNPPVLLLVVNVKENAFYIAWPSDHPNASRLKGDVRIPVTKIDSESKAQLLERLTAAPR
jgi:hypothetical protein